MVIGQTRLKEREKELKDLLANLREQSRHWKILQAKLDQCKASNVLPSDIDFVDSERAQIEERARKLTRAWREDITQIGTIITNAQEEILKARMLPISTLFDSFHRTVRDLSAKLGKEIDFIVEGSETELDKKMIEVINDPLVHLVRNAVDHGIEKPADREKIGKTRRGTVRLSACQEGDNVIIEISDDGAGIDPEQVKRVAIERELIDGEQAKAMDDKQAIELLFRSGFSTRSQTTDISGRGIGMDVVKRNVEELKGMIDFKSEKGEGTTVILAVPLTTAVIRVLLVSVGEHCLAVPTTTVEETLRIDPEKIKTVEKKEVIILREHPLPLARLGQILGLEEKSQGENEKDIQVVVINFAEMRIGFMVDGLVGEQQIVIKTLGSYLKKVENVAGATIMSSGDVVIILNVPGLINAARGISKKEEELIVEEVEEKRPRILVVEDALTTRELEKHILEVAGYEVDVAVDGLDALEKVRQKSYDLLVVDVQMPRLDGFELTKRLKTDAKYRDIPIVIVTTMEKEKDKRKGIEVGADAYMVKSAFDQGNFLDTIERLI
jgi:two-component system chemotaxis sensor kinase CheA